MAETLGEVKARLEADVRRRTRMVAALDRILTTGLPAAEVRLVTEPSRRVAVVRDVGAPERVAELTSACIGRLLRALAEAGQPVRSPLIGLFPLDFTPSIAVAAAAEVDADVAGTTTEVLPGGPARVRHAPRAVRPHRADRARAAGLVRRPWAHAARAAARGVPQRSPHDGTGAAGDPPDDQVGGTRMTDWYTAADTPEPVELGSAVGLSVTGRGEPGGASYVDSVRALYAVAGQLGPPAPLEGRWWVEVDRPPFEVPREQWCWHLFLRVPEDIDPGAMEQARRRALAGAGPTVNRVQLVTWHEGRCVQVMHHGPYADEPRTLATMDGFMRSAGLVHAGMHHEIYLTDVNGPPAQARTILRQPVRELAPTNGTSGDRDGAQPQST
ncbi:MAG TPA: GyrI-like domain-containing protein [Actinophytocola sp.]|uniref:GyrI-like domain-containing protein n=1 Tax=Actinophytocola sp. TaxID=1872138 RepID=UPI002DDCAB64|nr:GyrI-like domain-containing protein [Actinophytocola sp.]HEV2781014.1 GyrI-like domain-containing protein [Actinophytocola sp.]